MSLHTATALFPEPIIKFGTDGWRGIIADDFTGANVRLVSLATANYLKRPEVPGEMVAVVGYDNLDLATVIEPALTAPAVPYCVSIVS